MTPRSNVYEPPTSSDLLSRGRCGHLFSRFKAAPADGYTLPATTTSNLLNGALCEDLSYDFIRDSARIASVSVQPLVLEVGPEASARTLAQLIAQAKANPGKLNVGHSGRGTISHLAVEALKQKAGIDFLTVPYRGAAPLLTDLLGAGHQGRGHQTLRSTHESRMNDLRSGRA